MELVGFRSRHAVSRLVDRLVAEGLVTKDPQGKLIPRALNGEVPLLGIVEADFPSPAEEELIDTMSLDEYLIENQEATPLPSPALRLAFRFPLTHSQHYDERQSLMEETWTGRHCWLISLGLSIRNCRCATSTW
jgi:hypothetical protein